MKIRILSLLAFFLIQIVSINAQFLFVDQENWFESENYISEFPRDLSIHVGDNIGGDTMNISYKYSSGKIAIKGQYIDSKDGKQIKVGTWDFYYPNGKAIQSQRQYNSKGALSKIINLKTPQNTALDIGFPHRNRDKTYYGHQFRYDSKGELVKIVRYSKGFLVDEFEIDKFKLSRLKTAEIRQYKTVDSEMLDELDFETALEILPSDPKPILLRVTQSWNGYSRRATKTMQTTPLIAQMIKENYHLVYLDLEYKHDIKFTHKGETLSFKGNPRRWGQHELITKFFKKSIRSTPTYYLVSPDLEILATMKGVEPSPAKFEHQLKYFIDGHYEFMNYKEYNPDKK